MTDDPTRPIEPPPDRAAPRSRPPATGRRADAAARRGPASCAVGAPHDRAAAGSASRARWAIGLGVAGLGRRGRHRRGPAARQQAHAGGADVHPGRRGHRRRGPPGAARRPAPEARQPARPFPGLRRPVDAHGQARRVLRRSSFGRASGGSVDYRRTSSRGSAARPSSALLPTSDGTDASPMASFHGVASLTTTGTVVVRGRVRRRAVTHETYRGLDLSHRAQRRRRLRHRRHAGAAR